MWLVNKAVEARTQNDMEAGPSGPPCGQKFQEVDWEQAPYNVKVKVDIA